MEHKKYTVVIIAALITSLLLVGQILAPLQLYAAKGRGGFPDTSSLKHSIRDGVSVNLDHRDQHMNQENLCYRSNTCRQSNVGQNTLGNDNQVTGFADQSDNLQQAAAPVTPTNQTASTGKGVGTTTTNNNFTTINNFTTLLNNNIDCPASASNSQVATVGQQ